MFAVWAWKYGETDDIDDDTMIMIEEELLFQCRYVFFTYCILQACDWPFSCSEISVFRQAIEMHDCILNTGLTMKLAHDGSLCGSRILCESIVHFCSYIVITFSTWDYRSLCELSVSIRLVCVCLESCSCYCTTLHGRFWVGLLLVPSLVT